MSFGVTFKALHNFTKVDNEGKNFPLSILDIVSTETSDNSASSS